MDRPKLTLDTNLIQEHLRRQQKAHIVEELVALARTGKVDLAVTRHLYDDIQPGPKNLNLDGLPELAIDEVGGVFRSDISVTDGPDMTGFDEFNNYYPIARNLAIERVGQRRAPDHRDWLHLHAHLLNQRDAFITWDRGILCLAPELRAVFGIIVMQPEEYLLDEQSRISSDD